MYNPSHPSGSAYYGEAIENMPLLEAFPDETQIMKYKLRAMGYDCAEMKPKKSDPNRDKEKELAIAAKNRFIQLIGGSDTIVQVKCLEFDKYGRILINVWNMVDEKSLNQIMIDEGHGKAYDGGTKDVWE